jgi:hypothetical protein
MIVSAKCTGGTFGEGVDRGNIDVRLNLTEVNGLFPSIPVPGGGTVGLQARVACYDAEILDTNETLGTRTFQGKGMLEITSSDPAFRFRDVSNAVVTFTGQRRDVIGVPDDGSGREWFPVDVDVQGIESGRPYVFSADVSVEPLNPVQAVLWSKIRGELNLSTLFGAAGRKEINAALGVA